jgi:predicted transcriptional regulator
MRLVKREPYTLLAKSGAIDLITFIAKRGEIQALDLRSVHSNYVRIFDLARELEEYGIVKIHETRVPRLTYAIKLTSKGEKVAQKLQEAKSIVEGKT